jgi:hypothetical protein
MKRVVRSFVWFALALFATGTVIERVTGNSPGVVPLPALPPALVDDILRDFPAQSHVILMGTGGCGSPFNAVLNYLHKRSAEDAAVPATVGLITGNEELPLMRELHHRFGVNVIADDALVGSVLPYGNAVIIERRGDGQRPLVYQLDVASTDAVVEALDQIFGV